MNQLDSASALQTAIDLFNRQEYFECHEVLEALWQPLPPSPEKTFLQGWLQIAVGLYHFRRNNRIGTRNKLREGLEKLSTTVKQVAAPFDINRLIQDVQALLLGLPDCENSDLRTLPAKNLPLLHAVFK